MSDLARRIAALALEHARFQGFDGMTQDNREEGWLNDLAARVQALLLPGVTPMEGLPEGWRWAGDGKGGPAPVAYCLGDDEEPFVVLGEDGDLWLEDPRTRQAMSAPVAVVRAVLARAETPPEEPAEDDEPRCVCPGCGCDREVDVQGDTCSDCAACEEPALEDYDGDESSQRQYRVEPGSDEWWESGAAARAAAAEKSAPEEPIYPGHYRFDGIEGDLTPDGDDRWLYVQPGVLRYGWSEQTVRALLASGALVRVEVAGG